MTTLQEAVHPQAKVREWKAIVILILLIPVLWSPPFLFRIFLFQPFNIPSGSLIPTLLIGDYLFVSKYSYGYSKYSFPFSPPLFNGRVWAAEPQRGDIAVFKLPRDNSTDYIKRVIGLPGERLKIVQGQVYINDSALVEPYVRDRRPWEVPEITLTGSEYYVIGDNRGMRASDHDFGRVNAQRILGGIVF
jgi:signal peptidase I